MWKLNRLLCLYLDNGCNYEYLEDYIIWYAKENKFSINLDYVKARIEDIYKMQWSVGLTTENILIDHVLNYIKTCKKIWK